MFFVFSWFASTLNPLPPVEHQVMLPGCVLVFRWRGDPHAYPKHRNMPEMVHFCLSSHLSNEMCCFRHILLFPGPTSSLPLINYLTSSSLFVISTFLLY